MGAARAWGVKACAKCPLSPQKPLACKQQAEWVSGLVTECCPVLWLDDYTQVVRAHQYLDKGILPHSGGWAEQPAVLMQLVDVFGSNISR